jgi:hypothetical protein
MKIVRTITGTEPVTLEQLKRHLGFPSLVTERDEELANCLIAARERMESATGKLFIKSTVNVTFAPITSYAYLPYFPIISLTSKTDGLELDLNDGRISGEYESGQNVVYVAGYENGMQPAVAKQAILQCAAELYENPYGLGNKTPVWKNTIRPLKTLSFIQ